MTEMLIRTGLSKKAGLNQKLVIFFPSYLLCKILLLRELSPQPQAGGFFRSH